MNAIEQMTQQALATNHTAAMAKALPTGFHKVMGEALRKEDAKAKAEEAASGKWQSLAKILYEAEWRLASIDQSQVGKQNREVLRTGMVESWPNDSERANLKADPATLTDDQKKRNKVIRASFGPNFKLIEKYLKALEEAEAKAKAEALAKAELEAAIAAGTAVVKTEAEVKAEKAAAAKAEAEAKALKQFRKALTDAARYVSNMTGVEQEDGTPVDLVKAKQDIEAILGRFPTSFAV
jgi:colicin import membrane protein